MLVGMSQLYQASRRRAASPCLGLRQWRRPLGSNRRLMQAQRPSRLSGALGVRGSPPAPWRTLLPRSCHMANQACSWQLQRLPRSLIPVLQHRRLPATQQLVSHEWLEVWYDLHQPALYEQDVSPPWEPTSCLPRAPCQPRSLWAVSAAISGRSKKAQQAPRNNNSSEAQPSGVLSPRLGWPPDGLPRSNPAVGSRDWGPQGPAGLLKTTKSCLQEETMRSGPDGHPRSR